jgi:hypothetical protein
MIVLGVLSSHWSGVHLDCTFAVTAAGKNVPATDASGTIFNLPAGVPEVQVTATPSTTTMYWPTTVVLTVGPSGLTPKAGSEGFVRVQTQPIPLGNFVVMATLLLARVKLDTDNTLSQLRRPPSKRLGQDVDETTSHKTIWGKDVWPPTDWKLPDLDSCHFIDPANPVKSGALNFSTAALEIDADSVVLRLAGVDAPQILAVVWPDAIPRDANARPTPFLIFIEQSLNGNHYDQHGLFVGGELDKPENAYPDNFDYADMLFQQLHYVGIPATDVRAEFPATPFVNEGMKGVPYQVARAANKAVTVVPMNSFQKQYGVMKKAQNIEAILEEIQAFMYMAKGRAKLPSSLGRVAMASFSSGNYFLGELLADADNRATGFLKNMLKAVYFLDPALDPGSGEDVNTFINSATLWAKDNPDKRIRLYMRDPADAQKQLLGKNPPPAPYVGNTADGLRTAAALPSKVWVAALKTQLGVALPNVDYQWFSFAHHMFAGTMLVHALSQVDAHNKTDLDP